MSRNGPQWSTWALYLDSAIGEGGGNYTGAWRTFEEGSGSVERDRQNRDLYSNWTKCCENPANRSEQVQHNWWVLSTFCMTDNNTVWCLQHYIVHFCSGTFGSLYIVKLFRDAPICAGREAGCFYYFTSHRGGEFSLLHISWDFFAVTPSSCLRQENGN